MLIRFAGKITLKIFYSSLYKIMRHFEDIFVPINMTTFFNTSEQRASTKVVDTLVSVLSLLTGFLTGWRAPLLRGGMLFGRGRLTVPKPGVYFVYSQIYYTTSSAKSLSYYVCVNGFVKTMGIHPGNRSFYTISHGFLVLLNASDVITVKLGHNDFSANLIEKGSFFGAFLI